MNANVSERQRTNASERQRTNASERQRKKMIEARIAELDAMLAALEQVQILLARLKMRRLH